MPVELSFEEPALFILRASGEVTYEQVRRVLDELLAHPRLGAGTAIFIDNRGVTRTPSISEVAVITRQFAGVSARGARKVAMLTDSAAVYVVSQLFASFASTEGADIKVFREIAKAREWLIPR